MYWFKPDGRGIGDISLELLNFCRRIFQQSYYYNVCRINHIAIDEIACLVIFILYHVVGQFIHYLIQIIIRKFARLENKVAGIFRHRFYLRLPAFVRSQHNQLFLVVNETSAIVIGIDRGCTTGGGLLEPCYQLRMGFQRFLFGIHLKSRFTLSIDFCQYFVF